MAAINRILCSTGSFINKRNGYDHTLIGQYAPALTYQGFEIFMFDHYIDTPDDYHEKAQTVMEACGNGITFPTMHMYKTIGELISRNENGDIEKATGLFTDNCLYAVKYGAELLVLHLWGGLPSDKNIGVNIGLYPKLKQISDSYGLILTVENIVCNTYKPLDHMRKLWELYGTDVKFTIDVRQAEFHKSLIETCESDFLWENHLVPHIHISDYSGGYMDWSRLRGDTHLGRGDVDFPYFFNFLRKAGYSGSLTVEHGRTNDSDDIVSNLNGACEFISNGLDGR